MDPIVIYIIVIVLAIFLVSIAKFRSAFQYSLLGIGLILVGIALIQADWGESLLAVVFLGLICLMIGFIKKEKT